MKKRLQQLIAGSIVCLFLVTAFSFTKNPVDERTKKENANAQVWYQGTFTQSSTNNGIIVTVRVEFNPATGFSQINDIRYGYGSGFFTPGSHSGTVYVDVNNDLAVTNFSVNFSGDGVSDHVEFTGVLDPVVLTANNNN